MTSRRLTFGALLGLAAAVTFIALVVALGGEPGSVGAHPPGADEWRVQVGQTNEQPNGEVEVIWEGHHHDPTEFDSVFQQTREVTWTGSPGPNPCDAPAHHNLPVAGFERSHCSYVVVHYSPWEIDKDSLPAGGDVEDGDIFLSWCADINGSDDPPGAMRFNAEHVACTNKVDPHSNPFRQGDADVLNQHQVLIDAGVRANAVPDEIVSRGHHHSVSRGFYGDWHSHDGRDGDTERDEAHSHVAGFGAHWQADRAHCEHFTNNSCGGTTDSHKWGNSTEHKTVMFWVWTERAADKTPEPVATTFAPRVTVRVPQGYRSAAFEVEVTAFMPAAMRQPTTAIAPADAPMV